MSSHPDNVGPNQCSRAAYQERISHRGYQPKRMADPAGVAIARAIRKLNLNPSYPPFPVKPQNSEIIPMNQGDK